MLAEKKRFGDKAKMDSGFCYATRATLVLNSAENRLRVLMVDRPLRRQIHLNRLSQEVGPPLSVGSDHIHSKQSGSVALADFRSIGFANRTAIKPRSNFLCRLKRGVDGK